MSQSDPGAGASAFFTPDHRRCDELWSAVEAAWGAGDAARADAAWKAFEAAMLRHLAMEEEVLFPALEEGTGMRGMGPVAVMTHEHGQMRALLARMASAAREGDFDGVLDHGDTLMMLIQQHNVKEENILYPTADEVLHARWAELAAKLRAY